MYRSGPYLFIFILSYRLTVKIYLSTFLMLYMYTDAPVHQYTCSVYLFLFGITFTVTFQLTYWGTYTQIYPTIDLPVFLHASLSTKAYMSPQLLVYIPTDLPVHYPTCSCWLFHPDKPFVLTCPLTCCSKYSHIDLFVNQPVPLLCVCFSPGFTFTLICQLRTDRPTRKWTYLLILMLLAITTKTYLPTQLSKCP